MTHSRIRSERGAYSDFRTGRTAHPLAPLSTSDAIGVQLPFDSIPWRLIALKCGSVCVQNEPDNVQVLT